MVIKEIKEEQVKWTYIIVVRFFTSFSWLSIVFLSMLESIGHIVKEETTYNWAEHMASMLITIVKNVKSQVRLQGTFPYSYLLSCSEFS